MQVADERKESVISLQTEIHDLKRENKLQQRIISQFEREQKQVPEFLHALGDEIRVIKAERRGHLEKIKNQEKASRQALEERMKLQEQVAKLQGILKSKGLHNVQKLKDEIQSLTQLQQTYATEIAEFRKKANNVDNEYILEIRNLKKEIGKLQRDFHTLTSQYEESIEEVKV